MYYLIDKAQKSASLLREYFSVDTEQLLRL